MQDKTKLTRCVVIGSGPNGMAAAAVLAKEFDEVFLCEKASGPHDSNFRKSIPQGAHLHSLLLKGLETFSTIFPGFSDALINKGACTLRAGIDQQIYQFGEWMPVSDLDLDILSISRPLLDSVIFEQVKTIPNITILENVRVEDFFIVDKKITSLNISSDSEEALSCDVVVDASGLSGNLLNTLIPPQRLELFTESIQTKLTYASCILKKPQEFISSHENVLIFAEPDTPVGGVLIDIENDQWIVSLHGRNGIKPPREFSAWKEFSKLLPDKKIWHRIKAAEAVTDVHFFNKPKSFIRRLDKLASELPQNYLPVGDVINSFNPTFGQGISAGLGHVEILQRLLSSGPVEKIHHEYLQSSLRWSMNAWKRTLMYDSMFTSTDNTSTSKNNLLKELSIASQKKAHGNKEHHKQLFLQAQMLK